MPSPLPNIRHWGSNWSRTVRFCIHCIFLLCYLNSRVIELSAKSPQLHHIHFVAVCQLENEYPLFCSCHVMTAPKRVKFLCARISTNYFHLASGRCCAY